MAMIVQLTEGQSKLINSIAFQNGFTHDFELETFPGSDKGDNYLGVITKVTIKNKKRKLDLILKSASNSEALRQVAPVRKIYCRELYVYETIFVEFKKLQDEFNVPNPFIGHPKSFGTSLEDGHECLVMENLLKTGYKLWNRKIPMNSEHIKTVLIEYAKFHSISLAMSHKKPKLFDDLTRDIGDQPFLESIEEPGKLDAFTKTFSEAASNALSDDPKMLEVLEKFTKALAEYFSKDMKNPEWKLVVTHGDCWCNNLMFKYEIPEINKKVSKVCILDWQLAQKGSPAADLTYFFLAHSPKEILYDYKSYLKLYHDTLCTSLRDFSCDPEEIFPYSLLEEHWRKFINLGLCLSLLVLKLMHCDTDEALDLDAESESGEDIMSYYSFNLKNADEYNQRVKDLMKFLVDTELISS